MAMVGVVSGSLYKWTYSLSSGLILGRRPLGAILHSSNEPGGFLQWLCHDDSTINIVLVIIIIIIALLIVPASSVIPMLACTRSLVALKPGSSAISQRTHACPRY